MTQIDEVEGVIQILDTEEEVSIKEFERFESKIAQKNKN